MHNIHKKRFFFHKCIDICEKNVVNYKSVVVITVMWAISSGGRALDF